MMKLERDKNKVIAQLVPLGEKVKQSLHMS